MKTGIGFAALLAGLVPSLATAEQKGATGGGEDEICLAIGYRWSGTAEERRRISDDPVPASFRRIYEGSGCARFQLLVESLVDWHLLYGDALSVQAAVAYLEKNADLDRPLDTDFDMEYRRRWIAAEQAISKRLAATKPRSDQESVDARLGRDYKAIEKLPTVRRMAEYADRLNGYNFVASEYSRAAGQFPSRELVAGARRAGAPVSAASAFISDRSARGPVDAYLAERFGLSFRSGRLSPGLRKITLAVSDVAIAPDAATIAEADRAFHQYDSADYRTFLEHGYARDSQACKMEDREAFRDYEARCEENGFEEDALGFWFQRSRLELIAQRYKLASGSAGMVRGGTDDLVDATLALFQRRFWQNDWRYGPGGDAPQAFDLLLLRADADIPDSAKLCSDGIDSPAGDMLAILDQLTGAGRMISPARDPRRYRHFAEKYLAIYDASQRCDPGLVSEAAARTALLMRAYLASYDDLLRLDPATAQ